MTDADFKALQATMPWTERSHNNGRHTIIQIIDNQGQEVPLFTMTKFLVMITARLAKKESSDVPTQATTNQA